MLDTREKLIELLKKTPIAQINGHIAEAEVCFAPHVFASMADHLIANGVIALPFGIDDYVYSIDDDHQVFEARVYSVEIGPNQQGEMNAVYTDSDGFMFELADIGKTVFTSDAAAKAALKKEEEACQDPRS